MKGQNMAHPSLAYAREGCFSNKIVLLAFIKNFT